LFAGRGHFICLRFLSLRKQFTLLRDESDFLFSVPGENSFRLQVEGPNVLARRSKLKLH
jgi:hypothetical protein